ncbi:MAG: hypothetical protein R2912_05380 [Eubacteriales bacterium]
MEQNLLKKLFVEPTTQPLIQFFRYVFVGGCSFHRGRQRYSTGSAFNSGLHYLSLPHARFVAGG